MSELVQAIALEPGDPWEQLQEEPDKAFAAFMAYRDHPTRSMRRVLDVLVERGQAPSEATLYTWRNLYKWQDRAKAWTQHLQRIGDNAKIQAIEDMNRRHVEGAMQIQEVSRRKAQHMLDAPEQVENMNPQTMGQLMQIGVQIERQAMGISDKPTGDSKPMFQVVIHMGKTEPIIEGEIVEQ
jgi:hypothetical protein